MPRANKVAQALLLKIRKYFKNTSVIYYTIDKNSIIPWCLYYGELLFHLDPYVSQNDYLEVCRIRKSFCEELEKRYGTINYMMNDGYDEIHANIAMVNQATFADRHKIEQNHQKLLNSKYASSELYRVYDGAYADYYERIAPKIFLYEIDKFLGWWIFV
jgi:hypothetical protein